MTISQKIWQNYINGLAKCSDTAKNKVLAYIEKHDVSTDEGRQALIDYCYGISTKYGEAAGAFACQMYDAITAVEGADADDAELAETATYNEVGKAVNGALKNLLYAEICATSISRLVKMAGQDTTLKNAIRDEVYIAWIPSGDTCPYCLGIAAEGWTRASKRMLTDGHAEHIHGNCNCAFSIKHEKSTNYSSYDPSKYQEIFENAEGDTEEEKRNSIRRMEYRKNRERILDQKASVYEKHKELNSSEAEEVNVD